MASAAGSSLEDIAFAAVATALREGHGEFLRAAGRDGRLRIQVEIGVDREIGVRWSTGSVYFEQRRGFARESTNG